MSQSKITVVIADDHALVRSGLRSICEKIPNTLVVAEAADGFEAISQTKAHEPTLLLLDAGMPLATGVQVFHEVRRWSKGTKVVVVTGFTSATVVADWAAAGVDGLFFKSCPQDELQEGLQTVLDGTRVFSQAVKDVLQQGTSAELTQRERQILDLLANGASNKEIARDLSISPKTVDTHRTKLMAKLDVHSVSQLISYALKEGLLDHKRQL